MKTATTTACGFSLKSAALIAGIVAIVSMGWGVANATVYASRYADDGHDTDIRVWMEDEYDIYPSEDNLVFYMRAVRDCYATVYVVDTDGFIHVIHPFSPYDNAFIRGGIVYRINPYGSDIFYSSHPRGIAYVFAVASPDPFVYADFGIGIFGGTSVFRIYGDPFIACRQFHVSILPRWVIADRISVSFSYFYIREWARFPRYLCHRHGAHACGIGSGCRDFDSVYHSYRRHHNDPYRVLRPSVPAPQAERDYARIVRVKDAPDRSIRTKDAPDRSIRTKDAPDRSIRTKDAPDRSIRTKDAPDRSIRTKDAPDRNVRESAAKQTSRQNSSRGGAVTRPATKVKSRETARETNRTPAIAKGKSAGAKNAVEKTAVQKTTRNTTQRTAQRTAQISMQNSKNSKQAVRITRSAARADTRPSSTKPSSAKPSSRGSAAAKKSKSAR